jgi:hypothetical protein
LKREDRRDLNKSMVTHDKKNTLHEKFKASTFLTVNREPGTLRS